MTQMDTKVKAVTTITVTRKKAMLGIVTGEMLAEKNAKSVKVRVHIIEYPMCISQEILP